MSTPISDPAAFDFTRFKADPVAPWTRADLDSLPDDLPWRCEIVDGALLMSPSPRMRHEVVSELLREALIGAVGPAHFVFGPMGVDIEPSYLVPDLVVVDRAMLGVERNDLDPRDVHLVVEVVSPRSTTTDRVTKPAQYAAHGIRAYWRVETTGGVAITAYALREGDAVYTELGTWREGETLRVDEPFALAIDVGACAP